MKKMMKVSMGVVIVFLLTLLVGCRDYKEGEYVEPGLAFEGDSGKLEHTVIVPTLDSPVQKGSNVIWCGSFGMAWGQMIKDVVKEPIKLAQANEVAERLNKSEMGADDLIKDSYYTAAGVVGQGIRTKIKKEMGERFPGVQVPEFKAEAKDLIAYAYLTVALKFTTPYFDQQGVFTDETGKETKVDGFGLFNGYNQVNEKLAEQIEVLYTSYKNNDRYGDLEEYALDLCRSSKECQIIAACVEWQESLEDMVTSLLAKIKGWEVEEEEREFQITDYLFVPNINYELSHNFKELIGVDKRLLNKGFEGYYIAEAWQRIRFTLDKSGALLASDAGLEAKCIPREFLFNKPFLVIMRKRGGEKPFFVMWVDNAELLCKAG